MPPRCSRPRSSRATCRSPPSTTRCSCVRPLSAPARPGRRASSSGTSTRVSAHTAQMRRGRARARGGAWSKRARRAAPAHEGAAPTAGSGSRASRSCGDSDFPPPSCCCTNGAVSCRSSVAHSAASCASPRTSSAGIRCTECTTTACCWRARWLGWSRSRACSTARMGSSCISGISESDLPFRALSTATSRYGRSRPGMPGRVRT